MPTDVVICCDGTNNTFQRDLTNGALVSLVAGGVPGQHVDPEDRLFLFGFSRGACTVRVLAALLQHYGRLTPESRHRVAEVVDKFRALVPRDGSRDAEEPERRRAWGS